MIIEEPSGSPQSHPDVREWSTGASVGPCPHDEWDDVLWGRGLVAVMSGALESFSVKCGENINSYPPN